MTEPVKTKLMKVAIEKLRCDGGTQMRVKMCDEAIHEMAEVLDDCRRNKKDPPLPPVECCYDGEDFWVWDGVHRVHSHGEARWKAVLCNVRRGSKELAIYLATGANKTHGIRRSNADKRKAVFALLAMPAYQALSQRAIADHVGVTQRAVGRFKIEYQNELIDQASAGKKAAPTSGGSGAALEPENTANASGENGSHLVETDPKTPPAGLPDTVIGKDGKKHPAKRGRPKGSGKRPKESDSPGSTTLSEDEAAAPEWAVDPDAPKPASQASAADERVEAARRAYEHSKKLYRELPAMGLYQKWKPTLAQLQYEIKKILGK